MRAQGCQWHAKGWKKRPKKGHPLMGLKKRDVRKQNVMMIWKRGSTNWRVPASIWMKKRADMFRQEANSNKTSKI